MNIKPVYYLQTDARWKNIPYRVTGEESTIGGSGCGPSCAAMLISTLTGKTFTPKDACAWSVSHGYKALRQGTYYSYFTPQFKAYGIKCWQLNTSSTYGKPNSEIHAKAFDYIKNGNYLIALMGKGLWTSSGHFVVVWWQDGSIRINDPASTKTARTIADQATFKSQVKYYWVVDSNGFNSPTKPTTSTIWKDDEKEMTQEQFNKFMDTYLSNLAKQEPSSWSESFREWMEQNFLIVGDDKGAKQYKSFVTRESMSVFLKKLYDKIMTDLWR